MKEISERNAKRQFGAKRYDAMLDGDDPELKICDWKESVGEVLKLVDEQLAAFGLEVILHDTGDDSYVWHIEKNKRR